MLLTIGQPVYAYFSSRADKLGPLIGYVIAIGANGSIRIADDVRTASNARWIEAYATVHAL